jgi:quercetin dioxygenase-like cupin family protein
MVLPRFPPERKGPCWREILARKASTPNALKFPDGYKIAPHTHPQTEHVTVISGTFNIGMGEKFDPSAGQAIPAGGYFFMPAGMKHFVWTTGETVIQTSGASPSGINYLDPADDPRNAKK